MKNKSHPVNLMEEVVQIYIKDCINASDICKCGHCEADVRAHALNHLPPRYVASGAGSIYVRVNTVLAQEQATTITAIMQAIEIIKKNPRHDVSSQEA